MVISATTENIFAMFHCTDSVCFQVPNTKVWKFPCGMTVAYLHGCNAVQRNKTEMYDTPDINPSVSIAYKRNSTRAKKHFPQQLKYDKKCFINLQYCEGVA